jgi:hypothetical protein
MSRESADDNFIVEGRADMEILEQESVQCECRVQDPTLVKPLSIDLVINLGQQVLQNAANADRDA